MKLIARLGILTAVVGLALLIAALNYPSSTYSSSSFETTAPDANSVIFLPPQQVSITVTSLNGTAILVVAPTTPSLVPGNPIVNATVRDKDVVLFSVQQRGFYFVFFAPSSSGSTGRSEVSFDINLQGVPIDLAAAGIAMMAVGVAVVYVGRRKDIGSRTSERSTQGVQLYA